MSVAIRLDELVSLATGQNCAHLSGAQRADVLRALQDLEARAFDARNDNDDNDGGDFLPSVPSRASASGLAAAVALMGRELPPTSTVDVPRDTMAALRRLRAPTGRSAAPPPRDANFLGAASATASSAAAASTATASTATAASRPVEASRRGAGRGAAAPVGPSAVRNDDDDDGASRNEFENLSVEPQSEWFRRRAEGPIPEPVLRYLDRFLADSGQTVFPTERQAPLSDADAAVVAEIRRRYFPPSLTAPVVSRLSAHDAADERNLL